MAPIPSSPSGSDSSPSRSLVSRSSFEYQGFQLQGDVLTVGWDLTKSVITSLARSRIDVNAFFLFFQLGRTITWSADGERQFDNALAELGGRATTLWDRLFIFGFNTHGPLSQLLEHPYMRRFAALSACLSAVYQNPVVAQIHLELLQIMRSGTRETSLDDIQLPSLSTVMSLVERFSGILAADSFSTRIEDVMFLDGQDSITGAAQPGSRKTIKNNPRPCRSRADPKAIAEAVNELIQLCGNNNRTSRLTLSGGADAIAIAYIGSWLMGLPFVVYKDVPTRTVLHKSHPTMDKPRVIVELSKESPAQQTTQVQIKERVVYLSQISDLMKSRRAAIQYPVSGGRCSWTKVFDMTFDQRFNRLMQMKHELGRAIGTAARIFQAVATGDAQVPFDWRLNYRTYYTSSYGIDYINDGLARFRELDRNTDFANLLRQHARNPTFESAYREFEAAMRKITDECKCKICGFDATTTSHNEAPAKGSYCLPTLACTIISLIRILSGVDLDHENLHPKRAGIEHMYELVRRQHQRRRQTLKTHNNKKEEGYITLILDGLKKDKTVPQLSQLALVHMIFSGEEMQDKITVPTSAYESEGIVSYYKILNGDTRDITTCTRVGVNVGLIEYGTKKGDLSITNRFGRIIDAGQDPYSATVRHAKSQNGPGAWVPESTIELSRQCAGRPMTIIVYELLGDQRIPWLQVGFEFLDGNNAPLEYLGPAKVIENLIIGSGLVPAVECDCSQDDAVAIELSQALPLRSPQDTHVKIDYQGTNISIFRGDLSTALIAAWGCWQPIFLPNSNCVNCAIHLGVQRSWPNFAVVCPRSSYDEVRWRAREMLEGGRSLADDEDWEPQDDQTIS